VGGSPPGSEDRRPGHGRRLRPGPVGSPRFIEDVELLTDVVAPWKVIVYLDEVGKASLTVAA
jgi:hypothetical protein